MKQYAKLGATVAFCATTVALFYHEVEKRQARQAELLDGQAKILSRIERLQMLQCEAPFVVPSVPTVSAGQLQCLEHSNLEGADAITQCRR